MRRSLLAALAAATGIGIAAGAAQRGPGGTELAKRAMAGDASAPADIEALLEPLFVRKDFLTLDESTAAREAARLLGLGSSVSALRWIRFSGDGSSLRLLILDFGLMGPTSSTGYVAYGIGEVAPRGDSRVSWYHDLGRKVDEQGGHPWHPLSVRLLSDGAGGRAMVVEAAPGSAVQASGLLVLEEKGDDWVAARRIFPGQGARLVGSGPEGAVFVVDRDPPRGVLSGAPRGVFRSLVFYAREGGVFTADPVIAPVQDVVTATEALIAAVRTGDRERAKPLFLSTDVLDQMLYFSPGWKGGGRIVRADPKTLEIVYEERDRPTLRLTFVYKNQGGQLLLSSVTGRSEEKTK